MSEPEETLGDENLDQTGEFGSEEQASGQPDEWGGFSTKEELLAAYQATQRQNEEARSFIGKQGAEIGQLRSYIDQQNEAYGQSRTAAPMPQEPISSPEGEPDILVDPDGYMKKREQRLLAEMERRVEEKVVNISRKQKSDEEIIKGAEKYFHDTYPQLKAWEDMVGHYSSQFVQQELAARRPFTPIQVVDAGARMAQEKLKERGITPQPPSSTPTPRASANTPARPRTYPMSSGSEVMSEDDRKKALDTYSNETKRGAKGRVGYSY